MNRLKIELRQLRLRIFPNNFKKHVIAKYLKLHGSTPNIDVPKLFTEKVLSRILEPVDPFYSVIGKKHLAPIYVLAVLGRDVVKIPKRYLVTKFLKTSDLILLPTKFVIKSSFGSGFNKIVLDKALCDWDYICRKFNDSLSTTTNSQGLIDYENCIIIEEFIGEDNSVPPDYKVHCFHGVDGTFDYFFQIDTGRDGDLRVSLFDSKKTWLPYSYQGRNRHDTPPNIPLEIDLIIENAKKLSTGFDYLRVDFYLINGDVYFGELTPFHMGGAAKFNDIEADRLFGSMWQKREVMYDGTSYLPELP